MIWRKDRAVAVSPIKGSQGGPEEDISSQEDGTHKESQDINWELIQEEDGQNSEVTKMDVGKDKETDKEIVNTEMNKEEITVNIPTPKRTESMMAEENGSSLDGTKEQS